jgi:hypothetical protein
MAESKLHAVDDKLDDIEQILALYEAKLGSIPEEYFEDAPAIPSFQPTQQEVVARTENPLLNAQKASAPALKKESDLVKKGGAAKASSHGFVPPPPAAGPKYPPPAGMPPAKLYPISVGVPPPASMSFPGVASAAP